MIFGRKQVRASQSQEGSEQSSEGRQDQQDWECKCTALNPRTSPACWNCKLSFEDSEKLTREYWQDKANREKHQQSLKEADEKLLREISSIPITSIDLLPLLPKGTFKIKGLVSAQRIESTGFLLGMSGFDGPINSIGLDFSNTRSTERGEGRILAALRKQAHHLGANTIIGVDLDFSDAGGFKSVMICGQGTAVYIQNWTDYFDAQN